MEPVGNEPPFASGFSQWRSTQRSQHNHDHWVRFWSRVNTLLGCQYMDLAAQRPPHVIGDTLPVMGWVRLLRNAGFASIDILLRDAEKVILAALKP